MPSARPFSLPSPLIGLVLPSPSPLLPANSSDSTLTAFLVRLLAGARPPLPFGGPGVVEEATSPLVEAEFAFTADDLRFPPRGAGADGALGGFADKPPATVNARQRGQVRIREAG